MNNRATAILALIGCIALVASAAKVESWSVPAISAEIRLDDAPPSDGEKNGMVSFIVTPGEVSSGSVVLRSDADLKDVTLKFEGAFAGGFDPYVVKLWYQAGSAWYGYFADTSQRKLVPELLLHDETLVKVDRKTKDNYVKYVNISGKESYKWLSADFDIVDYSFDAQANLDLIKDADTLRPFALDKGKYKQLFLYFRVPKDAKSGLHKGRIVIAHDNAVLCEIPYVVKVLPFTLPMPKTSYNLDKPFYVGMYGQNTTIRKNLENYYEHGSFAPFGCPSADPMNPRGFEDQVKAMKEIGFPCDVLLFGVIGSDVRVNGDSPTPEEARKLEHQRDTIAKDRALIEKTLGHHNFYSYGCDEAPPSGIRRERDSWRITHEAGGKVGVSTKAWRQLLFALDMMILPSQPNEARVEEVRKFHESNPDSLCGWYANPHTSPENPDYMRRLNGLLPWHTGYDVSCNYAWWRNNWNDMATPYEPELRGLVHVYGTRDGVINTLAWEGIREGVNDIRYATLCKELALKASKSDDGSTLLLGRRVLSFLAYWDPWYDDPDAFRLECINYILQLLDKVNG